MLHYLAVEITKLTRREKECLAETKGKILMTIHPGEIGSDAARAQSLLSQFLHLARVCDAIVLVPAADCFVEKPSRPDSERGEVIPGETFTHQLRKQISQTCESMKINNIRLTVFWECLEAHSGVVILTTSRSVMFDKVALSRITFPIHYANFDSRTRLQIGRQELRRLQEEGESFTIESEARELWESTLGEVDWNGHEIRSGKQSMLRQSLRANLSS